MATPGFMWVLGFPNLDLHTYTVSVAVLKAGSLENFLKQKADSVLWISVFLPQVRVIKD